MTHSTQFPDVSAIPLAPEHVAVLLPFAAILAQLAQTLIDFRSQPITPLATQTVEEALQLLTRELGRSVMETTLNSIEFAVEEEVPEELTVGGTRYRRRFLSPRILDCTFGRLRLMRWLYEPRSPGESCLFPLEHLLGLVAGGATPALADRVGRLCALYSQKEALRVLQETTGLSWSHTLLRKVAAATSEIAADKRQEAQAKQVISCLREAFRGRGPYDPVLATGRDGVMTPISGEKEYREASVATLAVYDRNGRRLHTVYLGWMPESLQETLSQQLTALLQAVLAGWKGQRPRLVYITDGGSTQETYYQKVLRKMKDPKRPGERLVWVRVLDYYHAAQYVSKMAEALFGPGRRAQRWAGRMRRTLKEGNGVKRVLQSASYYRNEQKLKGKRQEEFTKAYRYLAKRRRHMNFAELRAKGIPIGSGVTEAGCKVVVTQRMKLSGMKWEKEGGQVIMTLRVVWLSGVWKQVWKAHLDEGININLDTYEGCLRSDLAAAA